MLNLNGIISVELIREVEDYTQLRFKDSTKYKCAEALALYEKKILDTETILKLCEDEESCKLFTPVDSWIPRDIILHFKDSDVVPVNYSSVKRTVTCVYVSDIGNSYQLYKDYNINLVHTTIYNYFSAYTRNYGRHKDLMDVPARRLFDGIINEGIKDGAADVTISSVDNLAEIYYNIRKTKVYSQRIIDGATINDIIKLLCFESPMDDTSNAPKYVGVSLNDEYRGRVTINKKYHGYSITIRILPNEAFNKDLESLNLSYETIDYLRKVFMSRELGLRLIVGSTMSGKNTTALACLRELTMDDKDKIVSIEMPVEQVLHGVEQINCDDEQEYDLNINSLLRQNPDFVYLTEIGDTTATSIMRVTNTGKRVLSTIHANSCADVIGRLQDITGLTVDRIIQTIHSLCYQELVRDDATDTVRPKNTYIYLSEERKALLYGRDYGEVLLKLKSWEEGDVW